METLLILVVVLLVVMVVGHGMWLAVAWILRGGRPKQDHAGFEPTWNDDRAAAARYLNHLHSDELIDGDIHERLMKAIAQDLAPSRTVHRDLERRKAAEPAAIPPVDTSSPEAMPGREPQRLQPEPVAAPLDAPKDEQTAEALTQPVAPPPPRRSFSEVLLSFMAERNIRWGELIGGLLILCCSTALVISLWSQIESIPLLKFAIFTTVTAGLFGAGLFVQHRWNLPTTGRAVLTISTMLVPLNLLAFAAFSEGGSTVGGWTLAIELASVALFAWLTLLAARVIMPDGPMLFAGGVVGISCTALIVRSVAAHTNPALMGTAAIPVGLYMLVMFVAIRRRMRQPTLDDEHAKRAILQLGVLTLACLAPFGLAVYASGRFPETLQLFAPLVSMIAAPALILGLLLWHRLASAEVASTRTSAAWIALVSSAVMLIAVGLAWPIPSRLLPTILVNALALVGLSRVSRHPGVHAVALTWFALAWVFAVHLLGNRLSWSVTQSDVVISALLSVLTGKALIGPALAGAAAAEWFRHRQQPGLTKAYGFAAAIISVLSVALVTFHGFGQAGDPARVAWVYALYAAAAFVATWRFRSAVTTWCGTILLQLAGIQLLACIWDIGQFAWPTALLAVGTVVVLAAVVITRSRIPQDIARLYHDPWTHFAVGVSGIAALWMLMTCSSDSLDAFALRMAWLSVLWIGVAVLWRSELLFGGAQLTLLVAVSAAVQHWILRLPWYPEQTAPWNDPRVWRAHLPAAAGLTLFWAVARMLISRISSRSPSVEPNEHTPAPPTGLVCTVRELLNPRFPAADRVIAVVALLGAVFLSGWSVLPGVAAEHGWWTTASTSPGMHAAGAESWILLGVLLATFLLYLAREPRGWDFLGVMVIGVCATLLLAARFAETRQVVSAWRWLSAFVVLASTTALWSSRWWSSRAQGLLSRLTRMELPDLRLPLLVLFALPVVVLTATFALSVGLRTAVLPAGISAVGLRVLLLGPVILILLSLLALGMRDPDGAYGSVTAALASSAAVGIELAVLGHAGTRISLADVVWLVQLNAIICGAVALIWRHSGRSYAPDGQPARYPAWPLLAGRITMGAVFILAAAALWLAPGSVPAAVAAAGTVWGFAAVLLIELALYTTDRGRTGSALPVNQWTLFGVVLIATALAPFDTGNWLCFYVLSLGFVGAGWLQLYTSGRGVLRRLESGWSETFDTVITLQRGPHGAIEHDLSCARCDYNLKGLGHAGRCPECGTTITHTMEHAVERLTPKWAAELALFRSATARAVVVCVALTTAFAARAAWDDPRRPWLSVGMLVGAAALSMTLGGWAPRRVFAYLGGFLLCLAASIWFGIQHWETTALSFAENLHNITNVNVVALVLGGASWLWIERTYLKKRLSHASAGRLPVFHHTAAVIATITVWLLTGIALSSSALGQPPSGVALTGWLAIITTACFTAACATDTRARHVPVLLYLVGLSALAQALSQAGFEPRTLAFALSLGLAGYAGLTVLAQRYWMLLRPDSAPPPADGLILKGTLTLTMLSLCLALCVSVAHPVLAIRLLACLAPLVCMFAIAVLPLRPGRHWLRTCSLALLTASGLTLAWSRVSPGETAALLHRAAGAIEACTVMALASGVVCSRIRPANIWRSAISRCSAGVFFLACLATLYLAGTQAVALLNGDSAMFALPTTVMMIVTYSVLIVCCGLFAVRPRFDPLSARESARGAYVYAAITLAGALALHIRVTLPWLFHGLITQYWPILVLGLAVGGIAAAAACDRQGLSVIARPLNRTGTFLPLLTFLEVLVQASAVHYSIVLFTAGAVYAVLATMRRSVGLGALAALALNGSLWYLLYHTPGMGITRHPQLWVAPLALAILVASHLNRAQISRDQRSAVHYGCLLAIYLSSTADIFLIGVARAPWLPLVTAGLSVIGVLVGLAGQLRSYLFLGTGFLCLSLLTMIWHAAADLGWTWVWYVSGIALGVGIIAVFALFEKKKVEMTALIEEVRGWSG